MKRKTGKYERVPSPGKRSRIKVVLISILVFLLALTAGAGWYVGSMLGLINRVSDEQTISPSDLLPDEADPYAPSMEQTPQEDINLSGSAAEDIDSENTIHLLLIGQDQKNGGVRGRADAMILCSVNTSTNTITMTSFLRDMYVQIPDRFPHKLNSAYALGGFTLLDETLRYNFGVPIDGNICVDFSSFETIVDMIGGVTITLTDAETEYLNNECGFNFQVGSNHVSGLAALAYSRIRHLDSDFGRTNRQRTVLTAIMQEVRAMDIPRIMDLLKEVLPLITTDLSNKEILSYAANLLPVLFNCTIQTQSIPAEGAYTYAMVDGMSVLNVDLEQNRQILKDTLR